MASRYSDRYSPPPRRASPPAAQNSSHAFQSRSKSYLPTARDRDRDRDRFSRERSYPPPRHYSPYDDYEFEYENDQGGPNSSYRRSYTPPPQRRKLNTISSSGPNMPPQRESLPSLESPNHRRLTTLNAPTPAPRAIDPTRDQEDILKQMVEVITDITHLKVEKMKAATKYESSKQKFEKNNCHYAKFPTIKAALQGELDKAKQTFEQAQEKLSQKDAVLKELAVQSLPVILPAIQACERQENALKFEETEVFKRLEKVVRKAEQQYFDLQQDLRMTIEEQRAYQSTRDKQYANLEGKFQELILIDRERRNENSELRGQLRTLNDELSIFKKEMIASRQDIKKVHDAADGAAREGDRLEKRLDLSEKNQKEKFEHFEAQIEPLSAMKSCLQTLQDNGVHEFRASTLHNFSSTLNEALSRMDSLPDREAYSSLDSRLESLEKEKISQAMWKQVLDLIGLDCDNRLQALETKFSAEPHVSSSHVLALENKVETLSKQISPATATSKNDDELTYLRSLTEGLQKSLNVVQINVSNLHKRLPPNIENFDETKASTTLGDLNRRVSEMNTELSGTNHSLDNLMSRVDNLSTGYLAQAMMNQLSETYPQLQNVEQHISHHTEKIREIQLNLDHLKNDISRLHATTQNQGAPQNQAILAEIEKNQNLNEEIEKLREEITKVDLEIEKLTAAADDDRKYISEAFESRLGSLVDTGDLDNYKLELNKSIKNQIHLGVEEFDKSVISPRLEEIEHLFETKLSLESQSKDSVLRDLAEKNASAVSKIEGEIAELKKTCEGQITNRLQEQKKDLEELVIAQVDRSMVSNRPDGSKQAAKRTKMKLPTGEENVRATPTISRSNSVGSSGTPMVFRGSESAVPNENSGQPLDSGQTSSGTRTGPQQTPTANGGSNIDTQKKKRKIANVRSSSPRKANGSSSSSSKKARRTPTAMDSEKPTRQGAKSEDD